MDGSGRVLRSGLPAAGYAVTDSHSSLVPSKFFRRELRPTDVQIEILYCGVCHSDIHHVYNEWQDSIYPMVPGHEITGRVVASGSPGPLGTDRLVVGDLVGVGNYVASCRRCPPCQSGREQYCDNDVSWVYNSYERNPGSLKPDAELTFGGYSSMIVVDADYVCKLPAGMDPAKAAPLFCAGITMWTPLRRSQIGPGKLVGIAGIGGLGHMGIKFAKALGATTVAYTTTPSKAADMISWGVDHIILSSDKKQMKVFKGKLDALLDTIPYGHDENPYLKQLKVDGTLWLIGALDTSEGLHGQKLIFKARHLSGTTVGGLAEHREMLRFCQDRTVFPEIQIIPMSAVNQSFKDIRERRARYRYVLDLKTLTL